MRRTPGGFLLKVARLVFDDSVRATVVTPMTDMFFGSREGRISDPAGNVWTIATLKENLSPQEMQRRINAGG